MKLARLVCLSLVVIAGCASAPQSTRAPRHPDELRLSEAKLRELIAAEAELGQPQSAITPSCERICPLAENIRRLQALICELSQRHPDDDQLAGHCREAEQHAALARARIPSSCACQQK